MKKNYQQITLLSLATELTSLFETEITNGTTGSQDKFFGN